MNLGYPAHVVVHLVVDSSHPHVPSGLLVFPDSFVVKSEVEVSIAEVVTVSELVRFILVGSSKYFLLGASALEQVVNLPEGDPTVACEWVHFFTGLLHRTIFRADCTDEVPNSIFDISAIYSLMAFKLRHPVLVAPSVVKSDTALPVVGRALGHQINHAVPVLEGLFDASGKEMLGPTTIEEVRILLVLADRDTARGLVGQHEKR